MVEVYRKDLATSYTVENAWVKNEDGVEEYLCSSCLHEVAGE